MRHSMVGTVLREERERLGLSQREVAAAVGVDRALISHWERGATPVPHHMACRLVKVLRSDRLRAQVCFECEASSLTMPYLDLVDMHPMTVTSVVIEELMEAADALKTLRLANKRSAAQLSEADVAAMEFAGEQVIDLLAAVQTLLAGWHEWYGFDVDRQAFKGYEKLFARGYATRQEYPAFECVV